MSELPEGWQSVSIGSVTLPFQTVDPTKEPETYFTYIDIGSIDNQNQAICEPKMLLGKDAPSRARRRVKTGDTLFSTVRTYLKNIALVTEGLDGAITSTGIAVLRPGPLLISRYLFYWMCSPELLSRVSPAMDGTLYPAVTDKDVLSQEIPLPPLDEQRRIVARLDALLARARRARAELARVPALVERQKQAVLERAFSGELTREWREARKTPSPFLGHLNTLIAIPVRNGLSVRGSDEPPGTRSLKLSALRHRIVDMKDVRFLNITQDVEKRYLLNQGDILISRGNGTKSLVGLASLVPEVTNPTVFPDTAFRVRLDPTKAIGNWLTAIWNAPQTRKQIEMRAKTTAGIWKVSQEDLTKVELVIPIIDEQHEIVRRIEAAFARIEGAAAEAARAAALVERLEQATLARAFRGEL